MVQINAVFVKNRSGISTELRRNQQHMVLGKTTMYFPSSSPCGRTFQASFEHKDRNLYEV